MPPVARPLTINRSLSSSLRDLQTSVVRDEEARQSLGRLLQSALQLEFATIPPYLSAAFSLGPDNEKLRELIVRIAIEEMLHMTVVANLLNAIGIAPDIFAATPSHPNKLELLDPPLDLDLKSFSFDLVQDLFMRIEAPEKPVVFPSAAPAALRPKTIGQFYAGIIEIIAQDTIPDLFKNAERDAYKQVKVVPKPNLREVTYANNQDTGTYPLPDKIDFSITDKETAIRHLSWVVDQGEGSEPYDPLTAEGLPGHYYRFASILKAKYLVKDPSVPDLGHSYSGGDVPFVEAGVHEFDANAKAKDYIAHLRLHQCMVKFNEIYTTMINSLKFAFNCPSPDMKDQAQAAFVTARSSMRQMIPAAGTIITRAKTAQVRAGIPFEYLGSPPTA